MKASNCWVSESGHLYSGAKDGVRRCSKRSFSISVWKRWVTRLAAEADPWFLVPWARFSDCAPRFSLCRFALFCFPLPLWCPSPLVPGAAAPVAYPSIHHCLAANCFIYCMTSTTLVRLRDSACRVINRQVEVGALRRRPGGDVHATPRRRPVLSSWAGHDTPACRHDAWLPLGCRRLCCRLTSATRRAAALQVGIFYHQRKTDAGRTQREVEEMMTSRCRREVVVTPARAIATSNRRAVRNAISSVQHLSSLIIISHAASERLWFTANTSASTPPVYTLMRHQAR